MHGSEGPLAQDDKVNINILFMLCSHSELKSYFWANLLNTEFNQHHRIEVLVFLQAFSWLSFQDHRGYSQVLTLASISKPLWVPRPWVPGVEDPVGSGLPGPGHWAQTIGAGSENPRRSQAWACVPVLEPTCSRNAISMSPRFGGLA